MQNNKIIILLLILINVNPVMGYVINEPLNEYEFNQWRMNITFNSSSERTKIINNISRDMRENIINLNITNKGGNTWLVTASLENYSKKINLLCGSCSEWYLNSSWETEEIFNITNGCVYCVINITTPFNTSDRWFNVSDNVALNFWNETNRSSGIVVHVNLTASGTYQIGKAINASNFYSSISNAEATAMFWESFPGSSLNTTTNWTQNSGSTTVSGGEAIFGSASYARSQRLYGTDIAELVRMKYSTTGNYEGMYSGWSNGTGRGGISWDWTAINLFHDAASTNRAVTGINAGTYTSNSITLSNITVYNNYNIIRNGTTNVIFYQNSTLVNTISTTLPTGNMPLIIGGQSSATATYNWIFVRKVSNNGISPMYNYNSTLYFDNIFLNEYSYIIG